MYAEHADLYDQIHSFQDCSEAVEKVCSVVDKFNPSASTLLDVGCGTGRHIELLRSRFRVAGLDIDPALLAIARKRLGSEVELYEADMAAFALHRRFDVVICLFGAISFLLTLDDLRRAIATMALHLAPGGVLLLEPWLTPTQYWRNHIKLNVSEAPDCKIAWMYVGREEANIVTEDIHYLIGEPNGVTHFTQVQRHRLHSDEEYRSAFAAAGLTRVQHDPKGILGYGLYVAVGAPSQS
ncbi:class I SAM-dependent methyltransferase [Rhodoblastus sp.]|uniref:class I SAM-dependent methyltransferase n=1 Tax=Rhodoblastus sp. TaxID=1962975 RepID=UPI0026246D86|nr:class I SAM-dependent methyltransferase [Rhodoblastus sp.]